MARPRYIDGVDDMLSDAERLDAEGGGGLNSTHKDMIGMLSYDFGFSVEDISDHLAIEAETIRQTLLKSGVPEK